MVSIQQLSQQVFFNQQANNNGGLVNNNAMSVFSGFNQQKQVNPYNAVENMSSAQLQYQRAQIQNQISYYIQGNSEFVADLHVIDKNIETEQIFRKAYKDFDGNVIAASQMAIQGKYNSDLKFGILMMNVKKEQLTYQAENAKTRYPQYAIYLNSLAEKVTTEINILKSQQTLLQQQKTETISLYKDKPAQSEVDDAEITIDNNNRSKNSNIKNLSDSQLQSQTRTLEKSIKKGAMESPKLMAQYHEKISEFKYEQNIRKYTKQFGENKDEAIRASNAQQDINDKLFEYSELNRKIVVLSYQITDAKDQNPELVEQYEEQMNDLTFKQAVIKEEVNNLKVQKETIIQDNTDEPAIIPEKKENPMMQMITQLLQMLSMFFR